MTREACAVIGAVIAVGGPAVVAVARLAVGREPAEPTVPSPVVQAYRYCPAEMRTRAAVVHSDGSAHCSDCNAHIPTTDPVKGGH